LISNIWIKTVLSRTTILIGILSVFVLAEAMGPPLVQPYDGTVWNNPPLSLPPGVIHGTYHSAVTNVEVGYNIYLPPQYATNPTQSFPVIYWLHGAQSQDENWDVPNLEPLLDFAVRSGQLPPMIMVWANCGHNTKYMDAAAGSSMYGVLMIETTIIRELIPHIDATYRTIASKEGRAVQGGSGGGMGALRFAFKYPQMFSSVFAFNPAVDDNASNVMVNEPGLMAAMFNNDPTFSTRTPFSLSPKIMRRTFEVSPFTSPSVLLTTFSLTTRICSQPWTNWAFLTIR
jgi:pimeloyl-ACP methyl ester carboxylesterase